MPDLSRTNKQKCNSFVIVCNKSGQKKTLVFKGFRLNSSYKTRIGIVDDTKKMLSKT
jgi:hypothetical protein